MRRVSGPAPGVTRCYTPLAFGNRGELDPVRIWLKSPTEGGKRALALYGVSAETGRITDISQIVAKEKEVISAYVEKVENYQAADGSPIIDGGTLAEHGETEIVVEVYREIMGTLGLSESSEKNSDGSSDFTPAMTKASVGTAGNAGRASTQTVDPLASIEIAIGAETTLPSSMSPPTD